MTAPSLSEHSHTAANVPLRLTAQAQALAALLHRELSGRWAALPYETAARSPEPLPDYQAVPVPDDLQRRRAELIVEASDISALNAALNSGAEALVLDFDDTFAPTRANVQAAYDVLPDVVVRAAASQKALLARPRALYAVEEHLDFGGPAIAALCDLAALLSARPAQPFHLYVPKLETVAEAKFWDDALRLAEGHLNLPLNTVRVCIQIETFLAAQHADALLHALHGRAYGLNAGRWDYVFSLIKALGKVGPAAPPRRALGMDVPAMQAYAEALVRVCQRRGAQAIGGSAALAPDAADPRRALALVEADKRREAAQGFTAAWAGLPELLAAVNAGFDDPAPAPLSSEAAAQTLTRLLDLPSAGPLSPGILSDTIGLALDVFEAWYAGQGVVVRQGRIEDTATAELARAQLWQWVTVGAALESGEPLTPQRYAQERRALRPDDAPEAKLLDALVLTEACPAYFPRMAQLLAENDPTQKRSPHGL
ncbi:malate synthase A [Deinococcus alpinitundrae]|uniref:malate synthase A n=1 Tax=Deinococcus alpinitundrae TaxID=468913 RepID=UPI001379D6B0|nr:malate synthase A [Deinococcus alpinitundrae]